MKSYQLDKSVIQSDDDIKIVKYTYKYVTEDEIINKKPRSEYSHGFKEVYRCHSTLRDDNGKAIGWIAKHVYARKV